MLNTLDEWQDYISQLAGKPLRSKVLAANSQEFVNQLLDEGFDLDYVGAIMLLFVRQMAATGMSIPGGGAFDLIEMADLDPKAREFMANPMGEREVAEIKVNPPTEPPDEVDEEVMAADETDLEEDWGEPLV